RARRSIPCVPTRRSSDLDEAQQRAEDEGCAGGAHPGILTDLPVTRPKGGSPSSGNRPSAVLLGRAGSEAHATHAAHAAHLVTAGDRKSTRLNSSHVSISY